MKGRERGGEEREGEGEEEGEGEAEGEGEVRWREREMERLGREEAEVRRARSGSRKGVA